MNMINTNDFVWLTFHDTLFLYLLAKLLLTKYFFVVL